MSKYPRCTARYEAVFDMFGEYADELTPLEVWYSQFTGQCTDFYPVSSLSTRKIDYIEVYPS